MDIKNRTAAFMLGVGLLAGGMVAAGYAVNAQKDDAGTPGLEAGMISADQAEAIALEGKGGVQATQVMLEDEDGVKSYEVQLSDGTEVDIDANSGAVLDVGQIEEGDDDQGDESGD